MSSRRIFLDFETRSEADLREVGPWAYSEHPSTDIICAVFMDEQENCLIWTPDKPIGEVNRFIAGAGEFWVHNVSFEYSMWKNVFVPRHNASRIADSAWRDSMAVACYYALPASLDKLSKAIGLEGKNPDGWRLITKYSKLHLKTAKTDIPAEDLAAFISYCKSDVVLEMAVHKQLGGLPDREQEIFTRELEINARGIRLDVEGVLLAADLVESRSETLNLEFKRITGFNPTQRDKVLHWFKSSGLDCPDLKAETVDDILEEGGIPPGPVRRALELRKQVNKASAKKLDAMLRQRGGDGRCRFQTRYHGTATGRQSGAGFQPLNMVRGFHAVPPENLVWDIKADSLEWLDALYGDAMEAISKASRHWIVPESGNKIMAGDFASIEAVVLAYLAGEQWKMQAFTDREPVYEMTAEAIYGLPRGAVAKGSPERKDGKTCELAFGYQGSLGAWRKFDSSDRHSDEGVLKICRAWREKNSQIAAFWKCVESAAMRSVQNPGEVFPAGEYADFCAYGDFLSARLPSGKRIWYFRPELRLGLPVWHTPLVSEECASGDCGCEPVLKLTYMSQKTGQWSRISTYGGKLVENITQATAREILVEAVKRVHDAGFRIILTVYDEIICEVSGGQPTAGEFHKLLTVRPEWAKDWPIHAEVWEGLHYKK